jgi:hypothetical protein
VQGERHTRASSTAAHSILLARRGASCEGGIVGMQAEGCGKGPNVVVGRQRELQKTTIESHATVQPCCEDERRQASICCTKTLVSGISTFAKRLAGHPSRHNSAAGRRYLPMQVDVRDSIGRTYDSLSHTHSHVRTLALKEFHTRAHATAPVPTQLAPRHPGSSPVPDTPAPAASSSALAHPPWRIPATAQAATARGRLTGRRRPRWRPAPPRPAVPRPPPARARRTTQRAARPWAGRSSPQRSSPPPACRCGLDSAAEGASHESRDTAARLAGTRHRRGARSSRALGSGLSVAAPVAIPHATTSCRLDGLLHRRVSAFPT